MIINHVKIFLMCLCLTAICLNNQAYSADNLSPKEKKETLKFIDYSQENKLQENKQKTIEQFLLERDTDHLLNSSDIVSSASNSRQECEIAVIQSGIGIMVRKQEDIQIQTKPARILISAEFDSAQLWVESFHPTNKQWLRQKVECVGSKVVAQEFRIEKPLIQIQTEEISKPFDKSVQTIKTFDSPKECLNDLYATTANKLLDLSIGNKIILPENAVEQVVLTKEKDNVLAKVLAFDTNYKLLQSNSMQCAQNKLQIQ